MTPPIVYAFPAHGHLLTGDQQWVAVDAATGEVVCSHVSSNAGWGAHDVSPDGPAHRDAYAARYDGPVDYRPLRNPSELPPEVHARVYVAERAATEPVAGPSLDDLAARVAQLWRAPYLPHSGADRARAEIMGRWPELYDALHAFAAAEHIEGAPLCGETASGALAATLGPCVVRGTHQVHDDGRGCTWRYIGATGARRIITESPIIRLADEPDERAARDAYQGNGA